MNNQKSLHSIYQVIILVIFLGLNIAFAQNSQSKSKSVNEYLSKLPAGFKLEDNEPQKYCIISKLFNRDISGNTIGKILMTAEFTRALDDGFVRWNNVRIGGSTDPAKPISEDMLQEYEYMEDFTYKITEDIVKEEFYKDFPDNNTKDLVKILVWDEVMIEPYLWNCLDKLKLNEFIRVSDFEDFIVQLGDWGTLKMRNLKLKWTGISKMNKKICALIHYQSFSNPVVSISNSMTIKGRSLYWGNIWVSLEEKQIEYGTLNEDVMMEMRFTGKSEKRLLNMQREVILENNTAIFTDGLSTKLEVYDYEGKLINEINTPLPEPEKVTRSDLNEWKRIRKKSIRDKAWYSRFGTVIEKYKKSIHDRRPNLSRISLTPNGNILILSSNNI